MEVHPSRSPTEQHHFHNYLVLEQLRPAAALVLRARLVADEDE